MITIKIIKPAGEIFWLDVPVVQTVGMVLNNPAFYKGKANDYSYPVRIDMDETTGEIFNWSENARSTFERANEMFFGLQLKAELYDNGFPIANGMIEVTEISEQYVEFNVKSRYGLISRFSEKKLNVLLKDKLQIINTVAYSQQLWYNVGYTGSPTTINCQLGGHPVFTPWNTSLHQTLLDLAATLNTLFMWASPLQVTATVFGTSLVIGANWQGCTEDAAGNNLHMHFIPDNTGGVVMILDPANSVTSAKCCAMQWGFEMDNKGDQFWPDSNYCYFPVRFEESGVINPLDVPNEYTEFYFNYFYVGTAPAPLIGEWRIPYRSLLDSNLIESGISPFLYALYILQQIILTCGLSKFTCTSNYKDLQDIVKGLCLINNINTERKKYFEPGFDMGNFQSALDEKVDLATKLPNEATVQEYIDAVCDLINCRLFVNNATGEVELVPLQTILEDSTYIDWTNKVASHPIITMELAKSYKIGFDYDGNDALVDELTKELGERPVVIVATTADFDKLVVTLNITNNTLYYVLEQRKFYRGAFTMSGPVIFPILYSDCLTDFETGSNGFDFPENLSEVEEIKIGGDIVRCFADGKTIVSYAKQAITTVWTSPHDIDQANYVKPNKIRFSIYRGMMGAYGLSTGVSYPVGTYNNVNPENYINHGPNLSLYDNTDTDGLYNKFHKDWLKFLQQARQIELEMDLDETDIAQLDFKRKYMINNEIYLIKDIEVTYPIHGTTKVVFKKYEK